MSTQLVRLGAELKGRKRAESATKDRWTRTQTPNEKRYAVMFFDHIDKAVKLPAGSAKRLLPKAAEKLDTVDSLTENSITFKEPNVNMSAGIAVSRPRQVY